MRIPKVIDVDVSELEPVDSAGDSHPPQSWWRRLFPADSPEYVGLVYAVVLVWGLGDVVSTYFAYAAIGDSAAEANPWISMLLSHNPLLVLVVKAAVVLYVGIILIEYQYIVERVPGALLWLSGMVLAGIFVVFTNLTAGGLAL